MELRSIAHEWDDRVSGQGLKAASSLIDARTELEYVIICAILLLDLSQLANNSNQLAMLPPGTQPAYPIVYEKLRAMETCIEELRVVVTRLVCSFVHGSLTDRPP